jgi:hypothetical protein
MPHRLRVSTKQVLLRLHNPGHSGLIDLTNLDLKDVDMQSEELKSAILKVTGAASEGRLGFHSYIPYINLTSSDLSGLNLSGLDLTNVIMSGIIAEYANFSDCVMSDTQLDHARCAFADFSRADLYHTKFYMTDLLGANFSQARMGFTHGFGAPEDAVERLSIVHSIKDAVLPPQLEPLREKIEMGIRQNRKRVESQNRQPQRKAVKENPAFNKDDLSDNSFSDV